MAQAILAQASCLHHSAFPSRLSFPTIGFVAEVADELVTQLGLNCAKWAWRRSSSTKPFLVDERGVTVWLTRFLSSPEPEKSCPWWHGRHAFFCFVLSVVESSFCFYIVLVVWLLVPRFVVLCFCCALLDTPVSLLYLLYFYLFLA